MTKKFAVVGCPINHSLSPVMHQIMANLSGITLDYQAIECSIDQFEKVVFSFIEQGGSGLNITAPFKTQALVMADHCSERAIAANASNLLTFVEGKIVADNCDGSGIVRDIQQRHHVAIENKRVLIIGAGGAARGIIPSILAEKPELITVVNRSISKAQALENQFASGVNACGYHQLSDNDQFDIIINATSLSMNDHLPRIPPALLQQEVFCYDLVYRLKSDTAFVTWAKSCGAKASDGLGMLLELSVETFFQWHQVKIEVDQLANQLKNA